MDLRALAPGGQAVPKYQPMWAEAAYGLLTSKRTNIEMAIYVHMPYSAPVMQTPKALDAMADACVALKPLLEFVLQRNAKA